MAVTYDFQTPGVSTSAADTQEDIRNIAEMSWVWHVNASPHSLTNKPTGLIEAFYDSTVDFSVYPGGLPNYGYQNYYSLKAFDGTNLGNVNFGQLYVNRNGAVLSNTVGIKGREIILMGLTAGYACESTAQWIINADYGNTGTSTFDPILSFYNQATERARIYTDTSDSHKLKFDVGGSDQMVIDSSGNVGIGTSSPEIQQWRTNSTVLTVLAGSTSDGVGTLELGSQKADSDLEQHGVITFAATSQSTGHKHLAAIEAISDGSTANQRGGRLDFRVKSDGSTSDTVAMSIREGGNVGIGTSSPARKVTIYENSSNEAFLQFTNSTTGTTVNDGAHIGLDNNEDLQISLLESGKLIEFYNAGNQAMVIDSSGKVGIGASSPSSTLHVQKDQATATSFRVQNNTANSAAQAALYVIANGNNFSLINYPDADTSNANITRFISTATGSKFIFAPDSTDTLTVDGGNVGIGTSSPSEKLEVDGGIRPKSYTVATLPSATNKGTIIYVTDETGGEIPCFADGTNFRRMSDRAIVSS